MKFFFFSLKGKGIFTWKNGDKYEGDFLNNKLHGFGIFYFNGKNVNPNWSEYMSEGGVFSKIKWSTGDVYEGEFRNGKMTGKGYVFDKYGDQIYPSLI